MAWQSPYLEDRLAEEFQPVPIGAVVRQVVDVDELEEYMAYLDTYEGAAPPKRHAHVMPLSKFDVHMRREIAACVLLDEKPPSRWLDFGYAAIESRAWYEWHWHRGIDPDRKNRRKHRLRAEVIARDGYVCGICSGEVEPADVHIDHIFPVSRGGTDDLDNLQVAHSICNLRKGAKVLNGS